MGKITYTTEELKTFATNIETKLENVKTNFASIKQLLEEVKNSWSGSDSNAYYNKAASLLPTLEGLIAGYSEQPIMLRELAKSIEEEQATGSSI